MQIHNTTEHILENKIRVRLFEMVLFNVLSSVTPQSGGICIDVYARSQLLTEDNTYVAMNKKGPDR